MSWVEKVFRGEVTISEGGAIGAVFPVEIEREDGDDSTFVIAPLYASFKSPSGTLRLTPLGGHGVNASGQKIRSVLGPLYVDSTGPSGTSAWLAGLGHWQQSGPNRENAWRLWPLAAKWDGRRPPDWLYYLTLGGWNTNANGLRWHLTPLVRYQNDSDGADFRAWPLLSTWNGHNPGSFFDYFSLLNWGRHDNGHHFSLTSLLGSSRSNERRSLWAWPLVNHKRHTSYVKTRIGSGLLYNYTQRQANTDNPTTTHHIPLLFKSRRNEQHHKMRVLFGAVSYDREKDDRTRMSVLKYLYRREREGDDVRRDIFPFVKWDSSPDAGRFSFLGRVWNMERDANGKRKGHVLFIPWGG